MQLIIRLSFILILLVYVCKITVIAQEPGVAPQASQRPKVGVALSGGGARGLAHIGVLEVLEQLNVPIDYIAGTSMGSIIGGLYASGLSTEELRAAVNDLDWKNIFFDKTTGRDRLSYREKQNQHRFFQFEIGVTPEGLTAPSGVVKGQSLFLALKRLTRNIHLDDFSQLPIAFTAVATDLKTAEPYLLDGGDLALAMRASMAVPFAFAPVEIDGHLLADGNILNNLPVDVVRSMGADVIIAINISTPLSEIENNGSFLSITKQAISAALIQNTRRALENANIIITPELNEYGTTDFAQAEALIAEGQKATLKVAYLFEGIALEPEAYAHYRTQLKQRIPQTQRVIEPAFVRFEGHQRISSALLQGKVGALKNQRLPIKAIEQAINRLMSLKDLEQVTYNIETNATGEKGLVFHIREKPWGPHYLRFGLNVETTFEDKIDFTVLARHELLNINSLGGEWINELAFGTGYLFQTEFYQPLDYHQYYFVAPYAELERRFFEVTHEEQRIAEYQGDMLELGVQLGRNFDNQAVLAGGFSHRTSQADLRIGDVSPNSYELQETAFNLTFGYDNLDDRIFARQGSRLNLSVGVFNQHRLNNRYQELEFYLRHHVPVHPQATLISELTVSSLFNAASETQQVFSLGGLQRLSSYAEGDINTEDVFLLRLGGLFYPRIFSHLALGNTTVLGLVHAGNVWKDSFEDAEVEILEDFDYGGLAALVWDTRLGTIQLGGGYSSTEGVRYFLSLGHFLNR